MTGAASLRELLARVEAATGPDRDINREIEHVVVGVPRPPTGMQMAYPTRYTESLDAAVALVGRALPHGWWSVEHDSTPTHAAAVGFVAFKREDGAATASAPTPALALCAALLRALIAQADPTPDRAGTGSGTTAGEADRG